MTEQKPIYIVLVVQKLPDKPLKTYTFPFHTDEEYQKFWKFYQTEIKAKRQQQLGQ